MNRTYCLALLLAGIIISFTLGAQDQKIFYNGKIFTADPEQPLAEAVAVAGKKITAVGSLASVKALAGDKAEMIDLKGNFLMPGMIDSHNHAISGGESLMSATLNDKLVTPAELSAFVAETLISRKGMRGDILMIEGMHSGAWAGVNELDKLFNTGSYHTQPVVLRGSDGHTAWVNQVMLKRAGITQDFIRSLPLTDRSFFGFDTDLNPNGLISEDGFNAIRKILPVVGTNLVEAGESGVKYLNSLGITAWMDPATGSISEGENNSELNVYKMLARQNKLTAHVSSIVVADANKDAAAQIAVIKKLQQQCKDLENVSVIGFKIFADGVLEYPTQTAAVSIPYVNSGKFGSLMVDPGKFNRFVISADREKLLVHVHAIGDRATTVALNAFSAARKANHQKAIPHSITHLQIIKAGDLNRFAELNVLASMQLLWATADIYTVELVKPYIDYTLYAYSYPAMSLLDHGTTICGASDWPVSSANPFEAMYVAETRTGNLGVLDVKQTISREEMLKAYTINAAKAILKNTRIGSIEEGKFADLVLVDRDLLSVSPEEVKNTLVVWTMVEGKIVYGK